MISPLILSLPFFFSFVILFPFHSLCLSSFLPFPICLSFLPSFHILFPPSVFFPCCFSFLSLLLSLSLSVCLLYLYSTPVFFTTLLSLSLLHSSFSILHRSRLPLYLSLFSSCCFPSIPLSLTISLPLRLFFSHPSFSHHAFR